MDEIQVKLWKNEQEILDVVHEVCVSNRLKYSLAYGTLLGAVRHGGFIPWDDDIDILMPREDYTKLLEIWSEIAPEDYILQEPYSSSDITNNFVKIRKNHTTFMQTEAEKKCKYHKGIFIDITPPSIIQGTFRIGGSFAQNICVPLIYDNDKMIEFDISLKEGK